MDTLRKNALERLKKAIRENTKIQEDIAEAKLRIAELEKQDQLNNALACELAELLGLSELEFENLG